MTFKVVDVVERSAGVELDDVAVNSSEKMAAITEGALKRRTCLEIPAAFVKEIAK